MNKGIPKGKWQFIKLKVPKGLYCYERNECLPPHEIVCPIIDYYYDEHLTHSARCPLFKVELKQTDINHLFKTFKCKQCKEDKDNG